MIEFVLFQPQPVGVDEVLDALAAAYAESITADSLTMDLQRSDGTFDTVSATLRIDRRKGTDVICYAAAGFQFFVQRSSEQSTLIGIESSRPDPRRALVIRDTVDRSATLLARSVPLGPLPQFWTARDNEVVDPAVGIIRFTEVEQFDESWVIRGVSAFGDVRVETSRSSGRLVQLNASLRDGTLELRCSPIEPGNSADWQIDIAGIRLVDRIDQLTPSRPPYEPGQILPDLTLVDSVGEGIGLAEWQAQQNDGMPGVPWTIVVVADATRQPIETALREAVEHRDRLVEAILIRRAKATPTERFWLRHSTMTLIVLAEDAAFDQPIKTGLGLPKGTLASTRPDMTSDRLPASEAVAIAFDRDRVIGAIGAIDSEQAIEAFVADMLKPTGNREAE